MLNISIAINCVILICTTSCVGRSTSDTTSFVYKDTIDTIYIYKTDTIIIENTHKVDSIANLYNITKDSLDKANADLFISNYKLERIRRYNAIAAKGNNIKFLRGWINRVLNN